MIDYKNVKVKNKLTRLEVIFNVLGAIGFIMVIVLLCVM